MQAQQRGAAAVLCLAGALVAASCVQSPESTSETPGAPPGERVNEVTEPVTRTDWSAAWKARSDLDDRMHAILPRWSVYTIQRPYRGPEIGFGCQTYSPQDGWVYFRTPNAWDAYCQLVAVPAGALGDPGRWVQLSMLALGKQGAHDYFLGLGISFADLLGITLALAESDDDVPALRERIGHAQGQIEDSPGGPYSPSPLPPEWGYGYGSPGPGNDRGGQIRYPQPPSHDGTGVPVPGHPSGKPAPSPVPIRRLDPSRSPEDTTAARDRWEGPLVKFFSDSTEDPMEPAAGEGPAATFRRSPLGVSTCNAYAASRLPDAALLFPEVAAFTTVCDSMAARPKMFNIALSDVRAFLKQIGGFLAGVMYGDRTYYPECHTVPTSQIDTCCRLSTGYMGENFPDGVCPDLPPDILKKYVDYEMCRTDSNQAQGF